MTQPAVPSAGDDFGKRLWRAVYDARVAAGDKLTEAARKANAVLAGTPGAADKALAYIVKTEPELRVVWGWASVIETDGEAVVDLQGDLITEADLMQAAHGFAAVRTIKAMHAGEPIGALVESVVLTHSLQKALGIDLGLVGWLIGARIDNDTAWAAVKAGTLPAFSIGGRGVRLPHG